jgi:hypothetical protein
LVTLLIASRGHAQATVAASLGTLLERSPGSQWQPTSAMWQSARLDSRWTRIAGDGLVLGSRRGSIQLEDLAVAASFAPPPFGLFRWSTSASSDGRRDVLGRMESERRMESALSIAALGGGAWAGIGAVDGTNVGDGAVKPLMVLGLWRPVGRGLVSVTASSRRLRVSSNSIQIHLTPRDSAFNDTTGHWDFSSAKTLADTVLSERDVRWTELEAHAAWSSSRLAIDARLGARPPFAGTPSETWGRVTATMAVAPRLALVAAAGRDRSVTATRSAPSHFMSLGVRVAPAALMRPTPPPHVRPTPNAFRLEPSEPGRYRVIIHVTSARTVELSGDFDAWTPIGLEQTAPDMWQTTLALAPGTYRVNVRVNGDRWTAPPGLPATEDEFNGTVGLLVVR